MKLLTDTVTMHNRFGDEEGFRLIREAGFDGVDYDYCGITDKDELLDDRYIERAKATRALLDKNGLVCTQAHAPIPQLYGCAFDKSEKRWLEVVRSMEAAAILGAKQIVIHATRVQEGVDDFEHTVRYYKSFEPYCEKFGIKIAIENIGVRDESRDCTVARYGDPDVLYRLLKALNSPWFVICVDTGHAGYGVGPRPEELIAGLDNQVLQCLHIHDNDCRHDAHALPFTGNLNWEKITAALKNIDYQGDFSLETVTYLRKFDKELTFEALKFAAVVGRYLIGKICWKI